MSGPVLLISKPVVEPWNDSGKNLVRDIVRGASRYRFHVMGTPGAQPPAENAVVEPVYRGSGAFSPGAWQNLAVLGRLLRADRLPLYHFFFAPNPRTSMVARWALAVKRRRTVHTVCSAPRSFEGIDRLMFADRVVVLSEHTKAQMERYTQRPVALIPPCVPVEPPVTGERKAAVRHALGLPDRPLVLYAGDYQFSRGARTCAQALPGILGGSDAHFVFACRVKQEESRKEEAHVRGMVEEAGLAGCVSFFNEVEDMEALAAAAALSVLPVDSLYAKMDYPLVLLESLREGVPIVVSDFGPLPELVRREVGVKVPAGDPAALAEAVTGLLANEERRTAMGEEGRRLVRERFSPAAVAAQYEALYDELLEER